MFFYTWHTRFVCNQASAYHHAYEISSPFSVTPSFSILVVNFDDFVRDTEIVVNEVLSFVGADPRLFKYKKLPPGMQVGGAVEHYP